MRAFVAIVCLAIAACQAALTHDLVQIKALDWVGTDADPIAHLTQHPSTCLTAPNDPAVQRGALLFSSPLLLGGQAAKAGLSCAACHRNGRGNPDFFFAGISGAAGTADVTHGLFSKLRADHVFNPVVIPDLATDAGQTQVDRTIPGELETFLTAQIVEEFAGAAPETSVIADLAAYIRAIDDAACLANEDEPQTWEAEIALVRAGLTADRPAPSPYTDAMRAALGRIYERFPATGDASLGDALITLSRGIDDGMSAEAIAADVNRLYSRLGAMEQSSLYDPVVLARALR